MDKIYLKSILGPIKIEGKNEKITKVSFINEYIEINESPEYLKECKKQLEEYFLGKRKEFEVELELSGTDFQIKVWKELLKIPYGKTITYKELAKKVENPKGYRAVGNANNKNKIAIIIPCHRVILSNGGLGGYEGGIEKKSYLIDFEKSID
ncbi:methylated-DNA--protein-cysteine methyltransferase [Tepiditoga spiralis]|uniref:Methylated-DNA--protein-cysteine methyltransferase n=1 Tax=Tepiditoga spiralis TaxID=2108365 RepID=A0A7G1G8H3_9BACT|nr:methylated-DNA--[protein]-cysteine S-methyltransferase [Tepiditoga spiralis]BBE31716.1 methylated-DNA--protein-cysteine methyltransferase [Tepiditoga spiralis]